MAGRHPRAVTSDAASLNAWASDLPGCEPTETPVRFDLPPLDSLNDVAGVMAAITAAAADGVITPGEAFALSRVIDTLLRAIAAREAERREQHFWSGQTRSAP